MKESKGPKMNGERTAEGACRINNQPRTQTMRSAKEIKGREQMQGICMPERHHEPKLVLTKEEVGCK